MKCIDQTSWTCTSDRWTIWWSWSYFRKSYWAQCWM